MGRNEGSRLVLLTCGGIVLLLAFGVAYALSPGAREHLGTIACLLVGPVVFAARRELAELSSSGRREGIAYRLGYGYAWLIGVVLFGSGVARLIGALVSAV